MFEGYLQETYLIKLNIRCDIKKFFARFSKNPQLILILYFENLFY